MMKKYDIIEIKDLNLFYGDTQALKDISVNIKSNSVTALIGPSGCGKSSFLKSLNRMNDLVPVAKTTGEVMLDDKDIFEPGFDIVALRKRVGMVFQKPNPFPFSIYDNVAYGPRVHGVKNKKRLDEIVEKSLKQAALWDEVSDRLKDSAMGLSGGQQQRLCIARVLAVEPEVILMASGSEVDLIVKAGERLAAEGVNLRLVSFPSWELFREQDQAYRDLVLPPKIRKRVAVEAGISQGWREWVGDNGRVLAIDRYGASAPAARIFEEFGFTVENVIKITEDLLRSVE